MPSKLSYLPPGWQGIKLLKHVFVAIETSSCGELELGGDGKT